MPATIIAQSTPHAVSAIHIVRVSGPEALNFLYKHTSLKYIEPRKVFYTAFKNKKTIDRVLCFYFEAPHSYTGEDMAEVQCHGSPLICKQIVNTGIKMGLSPAAPGEFTQRAFLNGKLSIEQAEAVDVLIRSKHEYLKNNALRVLEMRASFHFSDMQETLYSLLAHFESAIEFPEEDMIKLQGEKKKLYQTYQKTLQELHGYFLKLQKNFDKGKKLDEGLKAVIIGRPNVGKSTLMNALLREERVLVSEAEGTTRDYVREQISVQGVSVSLYDTAGIRGTKNVIEKAGMNKTHALIEKADILILLAENIEGMRSWQKILKGGKPGPALAFITKGDLKTEKECRDLLDLAARMGFDNVEMISAKSSTDVEKVEDRLSEIVKKDFSSDFEDLALLNERQRVLTDKILHLLYLLSGKLDDMESEEILAEDIKSLGDLLGELNLSVDSEKVFDKLFSSFCIGK